MSAPANKAPAAAEAPRAAPQGIFGNRPMGGLGEPVQKAKNFKGTRNRLLAYLQLGRSGANSGEDVTKEPRCVLLLVSDFVN